MIIISLDWLKIILGFNGNDEKGKVYIFLFMFILKII